MRSRSRRCAADEGTIEFGAIDARRLDTRSRRARARSASSSRTRRVVFGDELILKVVPAARGRDQPRARAAALPRPSAASRTSRRSSAGTRTRGRCSTRRSGSCSSSSPTRTDGWELALDELRERSRAVPRRGVRRLGEVTGDLHSALGDRSRRPGLRPEEPSAEALGLLDGDGRRGDRADLPRPARTASRRSRRSPGRGEEVRDRLRLLTHVGSLGQGDPPPRRLPPRPGALERRRLGGDRLRGRAGALAAERRRKRSPLRDVAGMLRSFAYAASAVGDPATASPAPEGWEERARERFLDGYFEHVDASLVPPGREARER